MPKPGDKVVVELDLVVMEVDPEDEDATLSARLLGSTRNAPRFSEGEAWLDDVLEVVDDGMAETLGSVFPESRLGDVRRGDVVTVRMAAEVLETDRRGRTKARVFHKDGHVRSFAHDRAWFSTDEVVAHRKVTPRSPARNVMEALLNSERAAPYVGRDRDTRWEGVVDAAGRLVVTDPSRRRAFVLSADPGGYSVERFDDVMATMSGIPGEPIHRGRSAEAAFDALVAAGGIPRRPGPRERDDDRLEVWGYCLSLETEGRADRRLRVRVDARTVHGDVVDVASSFCQPWEAGQALDAWMAGKGMGPKETAYRGHVVDYRDADGREETDVMATPGAFLTRFGCLSLTTEALVAVYESRGCVVRGVRDNAGRVLHEGEAASLASPGP